MIQYHTSLRCRPIAETLFYARDYARQFGITRVTNTTRLDNIGLPVFASIRPDAKIGSLCVSAGKGLREEEAMVGAYMEAIELAMAEPHRGRVPIVQATFRDVLDGRFRPEAVLDLAPKLGMALPLDEMTYCVEAEDLITGQISLLPAELVFLPAPGDGIRYFGGSSNGLSSGNSLEEATIHGILEVIERDILSFQAVDPSHFIVDPDSYPAPVRQIDEKVKAAGHELVLRCGENGFQMPFFIAALLDGQVEDPLFINGGYGCHFFKEIAMMRAATEAVQSRLSYIHGGRDDLVDCYTLYEDWDYSKRSGQFHSLSEAIRTGGTPLDFSGIPEFEWHFDQLDAFQDKLVQLLSEHHFDRVFRICFTRPEEPIQVVKIIIPRMEMFTWKTHRLGPRLRDYASKLAHNSLRRP